MTPQEIINEIRKLPPEQQREVRETLENTAQAAPVISEAEFLNVLQSQGIISEIPEREFDEEEENYQPIVVDGEPLSEMIIRERR